MKDYSRITALELAQDEDFVKWVRGPMNAGLDAQWNNWLENNPDKREIVNDAKRLILAVLKERQHTISDTQEELLWSRIEDTITGDVLTDAPRPTAHFMWYSIAAAISAIVIAGIWFLRNSDLSSQHISEGSPAHAEAQWMKFTNKGNSVHILLLEDGSKISLSPQSTLEYPERFSQRKREVNLIGEAFFEIARDPKKPFSVHTNDLVTQVLGTSFLIRAFEKEKDITVAVKTGKVSVFTDEETSASSARSSAAVLTPNQQVVYSKAESRMLKSLVENPTVVPKTVDEKSFDFRDAPIDKVFATLEEAYGVEIVFDEEIMSNCYLNAPLDSIPFHDQLRLICKGINAQYEIMDAHIIITGNGCN
jgi:transmembrane sensor